MSALITKLVLPIQRISKISNCAGKSEMLLKFHTHIHTHTQTMNYEDENIFSEVLMKNKY